MTFPYAPWRWIFGANVGQYSIHGAYGINRFLIPLVQVYMALSEIGYQKITMNLYESSFSSLLLCWLFGGTPISQTQRGAKTKPELAL